MAYSVPDLPYAYDALEPHIDEATMRVHHDKHHQAYVDKANAALEGTEWADKDVEDVLQNLASLPADKQGPVRNNAGGHYNHTLFWQMHEPRRRRRARRRRSATRSTTTFGSFDDFKEKFKAAGIGQFGSGWAWLVNDGAGLAVTSTAEPGLADLRRPDAAARRRRLGARLLPQVPEQAPRLPGRLLERRQLGLRRGAPRRRRLTARAGDGRRPRRLRQVARLRPRPWAGLAIACSAFAVIVRLGLTPGLAGIAAPSQTSRFS